MIRKLLPFFCLLLIFSCAKDIEKAVLEKISIATLEKHIRTLSSEDFMGRAPATQGGEKALNYLSKEMQRIGLEPINGSYTQELSLVKSRKIIEKSSVKIMNGKKDFPLISDDQKVNNFTFYSSALMPTVDIKDAEIVYVGYGVEAPEFEWDDYKGVDLKGKIILILNNDPQIYMGDKLDQTKFKGDTRTYYGRWTYKFEQAKKKGAVGAIIVHTSYLAGYGFSILGDSGKEDYYTIDLAGSGFLLPFMAFADSTVCDNMAKSVGRTLVELITMANSPDFKPIALGLTVNSHIESTISKVKTHNVYGRIVGSDPFLSKENIVLSAHYDHKGIDNSKSDAKDSIFNGAWDNASGTSSILTLAEALLLDKPKRSIIILACAAEESGTLGSQFFVGESPIALSSIVANINIDMPTVHGISKNMAVVGVESNSMGDDLKQIISEFKAPNYALTVNDDPNPNAGLFYRSDQIHFAKIGIPALFVMSGSQFMDKADNFLEKKEEAVYHTIKDEIDADWDLTGLVRDLSIIYKLVKKMGNNDLQPKWHVGNEFELPNKKLYNK